METNFNGFLKKLRTRAPVTAEAVARAEGDLQVKFPGDYAQFLQLSNGGEGFISSCAYVRLWPVESLLPLNQSYEVEKHVTGLLLFGTDGGDEGFGFDTRNNFVVVQVPFIGMEWGMAQLIGSSFHDFLQQLSRQ